MRLHHRCTAQHTPYRLTELPLPPIDGPGAEIASIFVDSSVRHQKIEGFGGAFTEAAALTFFKLPAERQREVLADTATGELHYQSSYYAIGHFSRFVQPGARRILCATSHDLLEAAAFRNPDGQIVVVLLNRSEEAGQVTLAIDGARAVAACHAHSIATFQLDPR